MLQNTVLPCAHISHLIFLVLFFDEGKSLARTKPQLWRISFVIVDLSVLLCAAPPRVPGTGVARCRRALIGSEATYVCQASEVLHWCIFCYFHWFTISIMRQSWALSFLKPKNWNTRALFGVWLDPYKCSGGIGLALPRVVREFQNPLVA